MMLQEMRKQDEKEKKDKVSRFPFLIEFSTEEKKIP